MSDLRRQLTTLLLTVVAGLVAACSGGGGSDDGCGRFEQNRIVHEAMLDQYYWYDRVPARIDYGAFDSPAETLAFLRYDTLDRFSYVTSQAAFDNLFNNGTYVGYGFGYGIESGGEVLLRFVYTQSPAGAAGLERGDEILAANGQSAASITAANGWNSVFGPAEVGRPLSLQLRRKSGAIENIDLVKAVVTINTVLYSEVIASGPNTIGYLVFNSFLNTSPAELDPVFAQFRADGVNRLVLDLRYNGGGSVAVARDLASYIRQTLVDDTDLFVELRFNDRYQDDNFNFYLRPLGESLGLDQVSVLTTGGTCSASEQVISALRPYLGQVTTVGDTTCGKPVGQVPYEFCDSSLVAVNFASFNANGQGEYFSGIPADCSATDDPRFAFGDGAEPLLQAARYQIDNLACPPARAGSSPAGGTGPSLQGLTAIIGAV